MGLFDFLSGKPTPAKIEKLMKRMLNEHHQQQVRQESTEELVAIGTPLAIEALVRRLGVNFKDTIVNEQEKRWVADTLVERFGAQSVEPLIAFIKKEQNVSLAVRTLARLVTPTRTVQILIEALAGYAPIDHRTIQAKTQIVDALDDYEDAAIVPALLPHLNDHDDDVRVKVVELLEHKVPRTPEHREAATAAFVEMLLDPEAAGRILRRGAEAISRLELDLGPHRERLAKTVPDGFALEASGRLVKR